jgi:hypothetical protein
MTGMIATATTITGTQPTIPIRGMTAGNAETIGDFRLASAGSEPSYGSSGHDGNLGCALSLRLVVWEKGGYTMKSSTLLLVPLALALSISGQILAQADAKGDTSKDPKTVSVTGCLAQSDIPGAATQFIIKSGEMSYALEAGTENLSAH